MFQTSNPHSSVRHGCIPDPEPALNAAWGSPERPLLVPTKDAGPPPPFALTTLCSDIRSHLVPAAVLEGHSGAALDRLEAHLHLGSVERVSAITVQQDEADTGLPHRDPADLEAITADLFVHLAPSTAKARLTPCANGSIGIVPVDGAWLPPPVDLFREDLEGCGGIDG